jgi:hypothetical protein
MNERIEVAFSDEYLRLKHDGATKLMEMPLAELLYAVYRHGWIRGHSERSREVQQADEQARREGKYPQQVAIHYDGDRLILDGRDATPPRAEVRHADAD